MHIGTNALLWAAMVVVAIANGVFGDKVVSRITGDLVAHYYKTALIIVVIFAVSYRYVGYLQAKDPGAALAGAALAVGLQWLASSIVFEFIVGHYVFGFAWERLFADYRIWEGRLWSLVLASEVIAPLAASYLHTRA